MKPETIPPERHVLIAGPTASGKSALALEIARTSGGVIVNADALQVYSNWRVLTARPSPDEAAQAPHLLYGHVDPRQDYSVGHWLREVRTLLQDPAFGRLIIVGGTGLYFRALTEGLADIPALPDGLRARSEARLAEGGLAALLDDLDREDPKTAGRIDRLNPMRVQRAWEVLKGTGRGLANWQDDTAPPLLPLSDVTPLVMQADREWLNRRIETRFSAMVAAGALDEVRANLPGWDSSAPASRAIGAPELVAHLRDEMTLPRAIDAACIATRQYAKRQRTWFRARMGDWHPIPLP